VSYSLLLSCLYYEQLLFDFQLKPYFDTFSGQISVFVVSDNLEWS